MPESPPSRRVDFDEIVTVEELRRTHPLRSSFLHGESIRKTSRSSTRSSNGTKTIRPGKCPVHGKKSSATGSVPDVIINPDVIIPVTSSRKNSSEESIGVQPIYAAPLKSALKNSNGGVLQKPQGWAGLQWALLMGCYALMLLLAVVIGVVLIQHHRQNSSADDQSGALPTQLTPGSPNDPSHILRQGRGFSTKNDQNLMSSNPVKGTKPNSDGALSRNHRGRPKSLTSQEASDNSFGSQGSSRNPTFNQAGIPIFSNQPSNPQSTQLQGNQRFNPSFSGNQNRGSSVSQSPTRQSSLPGIQTTGSLLTRHPTNREQSFSQQNINNRGSSPSRTPIRPFPLPPDQTRSSSFPGSSRQTPNQPSSNNQQRNQPSRDQTQSSSFPASSQQFPIQPSSNNQHINQPSRDQTQSSSFPASSQRFPGQSSSNNQQRNQHSLPGQISNQPSSNNQQRNQPSPPRQIPSQSSPNNQQRSQPSRPRQNPNQSLSNQPSLPRQSTNRPHRPGQNTRAPSSNQQRPRRPSQSNMQASQLPFNKNPSVQPRFPFEQHHRPASLDRTSAAPLPSLDADFTLAGNSGNPRTNNSDVKISQLWNHQNADGSFTYGYVNTDGSFKNETRGVGGCVEGIYGYVDPVSNQEVRVPYKTGNTANNCNVPQPPWPPQTG